MVQAYHLCNPNLPQSSRAKNDMVMLLVLHHFLALIDELWSGLGERSPQVVSRYGLLPAFVICLKFIKGNAFGLPTTIKQS